MTEQQQPQHASRTPVQPIPVARTGYGETGVCPTGPGPGIPGEPGFGQGAPGEAAVTGPPPASPAPAPPKERRVLRAVLRWTAAVVVFAVVGAGTTYGITQLKRTDVPGLATESDGRWPYPDISAAPLPPGQPAPLDPANKAGTHYADLRELLLPAPVGAKDDKALRGRDGWLPTKDFLAIFGTQQDRDQANQVLTDYGLRHIAARGWTTADGTRTGIYLLQFDTAAVAEQVLKELTQFESPTYAARGAAETEYDGDFPIEAQVDGVTQSVYNEMKPYGAAQVRQAYLGAADVVAVVLQSRKGAAAAVPFQQTVTLQSQLLN
jgi:hypothetical protein